RLPPFLRDHRVAWVTRRLETGPEDRPPQRELAAEHESTACDGRGPAGAAARREQRAARRSQQLRRPRELPRLALLVDLAEEPEPALHRLHQPELRRDGCDRQPA